MVNGSCADSNNPTQFWTFEYKQLNTNYADNEKYVTLLPNYGGKQNVWRMEVTDATAMGGGVWLDSPIIPFEQGCRYRFTVSIIASAPYHLYPVGYQFKPGLKPYENPVFGDMRPRFKGAFSTQDDHGVNLRSWTKIYRDFPDKQLSNKAMGIIKNVRMMSLHVCGVTGKGDIYLKDLIVEKLPDKYVGGKITGDEDSKQSKY